MNIRGATRIRTLAITLVAALLLPGCGDDKEPTASDKAGQLRVVLTTPNAGQDGAAVIVLNGPTAPRNVTAGSGLNLWGGPVNTPQATIALTGVLNAGPILVLDVDDVTRAGEYSATLREVSSADESVALRTDLSGYSLTVMQ